MKKIIYASAIFASMVMASCGGSSSNDLEQAQTFAVDVAKKISMNQKDSVVALYPDAEKADSFVTSFVADSVKVLPTDSLLQTLVVAKNLQFRNLVKILWL